MKSGLLYIFFSLIFIATVDAHEIRPGYLEINENADKSLSITWKQPIMGAYGLPLRPFTSAGWFIDSLASISYTETYLVKRWSIPQNHASLEGQTITIDGLEQSITDVLVQIKLIDKPVFNYLLKPGKPSITLQLSAAKPTVIWEYVQLGISHILTGYDHLLFVLGLVLLVKKRSRLIWTITAFTIAHSITLALSTLKIIKVSPAFTESAIALSIVFLAVELFNVYRGVHGFTYRFPWLTSFLFGLLHGLGFAGVLQDVGLMEDNIPFALFLFNAGVEIGQLVFIFFVLMLMLALKKLRLPLPHWMQQVPPYVIGTLAVYWFIERLVGAFAT